VVLPLHFVFFMPHYFRAYHGYSAAPFEWNHEGALAAVIERTPPGSSAPIFLTATRDHWMESYWKLALAKWNRPELLFQTTYFDSSKPQEMPAFPAGALVVNVKEVVHLRQPLGNASTVRADRGSHADVGGGSTAHTAGADPCGPPMRDTASDRPIRVTAFE